MLTDPCTDPGIFARVVQARLPENSSDNIFRLFCPQLLQFYSGLSMDYGLFQRKLLFYKVSGGGGSNLFQGGGGRGLGVQMLTGCPNAVNLHDVLYETAQC